MRFSIREMLALTLLAVLAMLLWRTWRDMKTAEGRLLALQSEIASLELSARRDLPALRDAIVHTRDEYQMLHSMRQRAEVHFERLLEKYSTLQPPDADVLAIRYIPSLKTGRDPVPVVYRLMVPEQRPVWLKVGISLHQGAGSSSDALDHQRHWLTESPLNPSGPFEIQLRPGDQRLVVTVGDAAGDRVPVQLAIDDLVLLLAAFDVADPAHKSHSRIQPEQQTNYGPDRPLPWLLTAQLNGLSPLDGFAAEPEDLTPLRYGLSVWLSDRPSGFAKFPETTDATQ